MKNLSREHLLLDFPFNEMQERAIPATYKFLKSIPDDVISLEDRDKILKLLAEDKITVIEPHFSEYTTLETKRITDMLKIQKTLDMFEDMIAQSTEQSSMRMRP